LISDGKTCAEVAALFSDGLRTVQYWAKRFNEDEIEGLRDAARPGRKVRISDEEREVLAQNLRRLPGDFGYSQNLWDGKLLSHHLKQEFNVELKSMSSKGFGQIGHKNKRGFQVPNTFFRSFKQPLKSSYTSYAEALYSS